MKNTFRRVLYMTFYEVISSLEKIKATVYFTLPLDHEHGQYHEKKKTCNWIVIIINGSIRKFARDSFQIFDIHLHATQFYVSLLFVFIGLRICRWETLLACTLESEALVKIISYCYLDSISGLAIMHFLMSGHVLDKPIFSLAISVVCVLNISKQPRPTLLRGNPAASFVLFCNLLISSGDIW